MRSKGAVREEAVVHALESPAARRILSLTIDEPLSARDLVEAAHLPPATVYRQVKALVDAGVLVVERSAMTSDGKPYDLYRSRIRSARLELRPRAIDVAWEPNQSVEDRLTTMWEDLAG